MYSTISDNLTREHLTLEAVKCMKNISSNSLNLSVLHKELIDINLSITAYVEESKRRLAGLRLDLAQNAKSSYEVVEVLSEKYNGTEPFVRESDSHLFNIPVLVKSPLSHLHMSLEHKMSKPNTPRKRNPTKTVKPHENNNNTHNKFSQRQQARTFIAWYNHMIDNERLNLGLYMSDDAALEWFGRTIKTRKKVTAFLKHDMQCSRHDFTTVESIDKIESRHERLQRKDDSILASPLHSPEIIGSRERPCKRKLRSRCSSPQWAEGCQPNEPSPEKKRKTDNPLQIIVPTIKICQNTLKRPLPDDTAEINNQGDSLLRKVKRKCVPVTPPNQEVGQGDCLPSTSGTDSYTDSDKSHDALNAQLPKLAVECNGYIEFTRTRNSRSSDAMKWERKCKVQISYSEDPLNVGEYIIWTLRYADESRCRRNLLAAFEEAAKEDEMKKI